MIMAIKILQSCASNTWRNHCGISEVFRVLLYSTAAMSSSSSKDTLYNRILPFGNPRDSIVPVLDQWVREGGPVEQYDLQIVIKQLRKYKRFTHALQLSEWMSNKRYLDLLPRDAAVRLDLISKVHGIEQAEKYFNNIPISLRGLQVYGALLNCYVTAKKLEKAEATMQKIRDLGLARTALPYNVMLKLYADIGKHENLDSLIQEMEEKGITCDKFTYSTRLHAYATVSDIEGMEKFLMKMEADPVVTMNWHEYVVAANGYIKAGARDNAFAMLKKSEQLIRGKTRRFAYEVLLTLYATIGDKNEVYRIWNLYKQMGKIYNMSYLGMISSLIKLDDLDGAEKIWEEWEVEKSFFDFRLPNLLISAYCKKGLLGKAEAIVDRLVEIGEEPTPSIWQHLAFGYFEHDLKEKAVETMKKAILACRLSWNPKLGALAACFEYLKEEGSFEVAYELVGLLKEKGVLPTEVCDRLVTYVQNVNPTSNALELLGGNNQGLGEE